MSLPTVATPSETIGRNVLESLLEGCQVIDFNWTYLFVNDAVVRHGKKTRQELLGRTMMECYPGIERTEMFAHLSKCMSERLHLRMENEFTYPDGSKAWFELRFVPVPDGVCVLSLDATERNLAEAALLRSEAQLRHAQKMEAVGQLAGGVAHDFNNVLSVILSYTELLLSELKSTDPLRADIHEIHEAGERATRLTHQLLAFSRHQVASPRVIDLDRVVARMETMMRRLLGAGIELNVVAMSSPAKLKIDPSQLEQVVMNLVVNARDAMPDGGMLTLETKVVELDAEYTATHHGVAPGPHILVAVSDTGTGISLETQARIFEPFFTTKQGDKGTGLGLSTVFGIVKQNGGHIWVYSEPGHGAVFKVYFPCVADSTDDSADPKIVMSATTGTETILAVEDDPQVRRVVCDVLRRAGYCVLEAANGGEAFLMCEQHHATIHLLLTDVILPRMNGRQLADRLSAIRPHMKVLFMSGYADGAVLQHGILESGIAYFQKPVTPDKLKRRVREVLDSSRLP